MSRHSDPAAKRSARRARGLQTLGFAILLWVSYGSYAMVKWAGVLDPWAYLYPVIVDLGVVLVMPYANDALLPADGDWPVRKNAKDTIKLAFAAIFAFNALHTVLAALAGVALPVWLRPVIALTAGAVPVVLYIRVMSLHALATAWESAEIQREQRENKAARENALREAEARADAERLQAVADQREADRARRENDAEVARIHAQAEADAARESAREAAREEVRQRRADRDASTRGTRAAPTRATDVETEKVEFALAKYAAEDRVTLDGIVASLGSGTKGQRGKRLLAEAWDAGIELQPTDAGRLLGFDGGYGRNLRQKLKEEGTLPPSERPRLALASH